MALGRRKRVERRLAAILMADVAGYSRLMGADEEGTLARLQALRRELFDPQVAEHHGRIVKVTGDGMLVAFSSVVDAVRCAVAVQQAMPERNADIPKARQIELRIGINLGDVIVDGDDLYGDGVNIAARIEALADPGGVCVSNTVYDQVRDRLPFLFEDLGEHQLKNIARPLRVYRIALTHPVADAPGSPLERQRRESGEGSLPLARQAVDCSAALCQYKRRPRAGIFRRRHGRGDHNRPLRHPLALRHRPQFEF